MDATPLFMNWSREGERQGSFGIIRTGVVKPGALTAELLDVQDSGEASWVREGHWSLGKVIGRGATGTVHMGMIKDTGRLIAVKVIEMHHHARSGASGSEHAHHHHREVQMMRLLRHPNLVAFLGSTSRGNELFILQEWVPGGSLLALLSSFGRLNTKVVRHYARQVLHGLAYLHANTIAHRDLKCANLLVDAGGNVKIADFGTSAVVSQCRGNHGQLIGTPIYMAPELLFQGKHGLPVDIWAFGAAVLEMATALAPWRIQGPEGMPSIDYLRCLVAKEHAPALPLDLDAALRSMLMQCFCWRSGDRPTCSALLAHDFL
ncbi:kinase-like domain-containing protein, partial [Tribonema minus]